MQRLFDLRLMTERLITAAQEVILGNNAYGRRYMGGEAIGILNEAFAVHREEILAHGSRSPEAVQALLRHVAKRHLWAYEQEIVNEAITLCGLPQVQSRDIPSMVGEASPISEITEGYVTPRVIARMVSVCLRQVLRDEVVEAQFIPDNDSALMTQRERGKGEPREIDRLPIYIFQPISAYLRKQAGLDKVDQSEACKGEVAQAEGCLVVQFLPQEGNKLPIISIRKKQS